MVQVTWAQKFLRYMLAMLELSVPLPHMNALIFRLPSKLNLLMQQRPGSSSADRLTLAIPANGSPIKEAKAKAKINESVAKKIEYTHR